MENPPGLGKPEVHELATNVLAITGLYHSAGKGFGVNSGIIFTSKSIVFIDSGMTYSSGEFLWQVASERTSEGKSLYLILTHHHSDHVFGMRVLKDKGAKVIAHQAVKKFLENDNGYYKHFIIEQCGLSTSKGNQIFGDVMLSLPDLLIASDTILNIDGDEVHLLATPGHVPSELSIYHPGSQTLFAGDTIYEGTPPTTRFGGRVEWELWVAQLERLAQLKIGIICPGHGGLCSKSEIDHNIGYLRNLCR